MSRRRGRSRSGAAKAPGIRVVPQAPGDVDGRDTPGHDDVKTDQSHTQSALYDSPKARGGCPGPGAALSCLLR
ncbi:hypothetical protein BBta_2291 [Bradyrhizobium sp. BTAi1]|nr:hypothetical protein BBta_2291 [Bradyrhizobium sp. BTAi1]